MQLYPGLKRKNAPGSSARGMEARPHGPRKEPDADPLLPAPGRATNRGRGPTVLVPC